MCNKKPESPTPIPREEDLTAPFLTLTEAADNDLTPGSTFAGRYLIIEELGRGGMGKVYKAFDGIVNEMVALKTIRAEVASRTATIQRFAAELKITRQIVHRNVGRMYEINQEAGTFYITMEYVSGQDLKGLLRQTGQLTIESAISIARQACLGLAEAHRLGVVHRDLKPSNIMVDAEGNVRIIDFGIARSLETTGLTLADGLIGTPSYMSPEQAQGGEIDHRADIYSLGSILFEMLTGRLPFVGNKPIDLVRMHISKLPPDPREINPRIPEFLGSVILKCLEKKKEKRYQSTLEVSAALEPSCWPVTMNQMVFSDPHVGQDNQQPGTECTGWAAARPPIERPAPGWPANNHWASRGRCPAR